MHIPTDTLRTIFFSLALWLGAVSALAQAKAPLTNIQSVLNLPEEALAAKPPLELRAVVTCVDRSYNMLFVQDDTGGIFLYQVVPSVQLDPGDWLALRGVAGRGRLSPIIASAQVTVLGKTNLPVARPVSIGTVNAGFAVGERIEVQGVVQHVRLRGDHLLLQLVSGDNRCTISIIHTNAEIPKLVDARVRVRGVASASFNKQHDLLGFQVAVQDISEVQTMGQPTVPAFDSAIRAASDLTRRAAYGAGEHRVHVRGVITLHRPERVTVIQDSTGGIVIEGGLPGEFKAGEEVEAVGFLAHPFQEGRLRHAEGRRLGEGKAVGPQPITLEQAEERKNQLVQVLARVVDWQPVRDGEISAVLSSSNQLFKVTLPAAGVPGMAASFPADSLVSVAGVVRVTTREFSKVPDISLLARGPADFRLLQSPPASPWRWVWLAGGALAAVVTASGIALVLVWLRHRRSLTAVTAQQNATESRFAELEQELRSSHRERELIQQELHDNIIQSIYSVGLGLDEARQLAAKQPERLPERLNVAVETLNALIRDVRAFLGGLEPKGLEGHELKAALKSVLLASGEDQQARFSIRIDPSAARSLTTLQATEVFNIAKEAMTNSMRHAHATLTTVALVASSRGVRLEIEDNGVGFDSARVEQDSWGLRHMQQRARAMGADFDLETEPDRGVRIRVEILRSSVHSSRAVHDNQ